MVVGVRDLDHRRVAIEQLVHEIADVRRQEPELGTEERDAAAHLGQHLVDRARREAAEDERIELPGEAARYLAQRVAGDVVHDEGIHARLLRHQPVVVERGLEIRVELRVAEGLAAGALFLFGIRLAHG